MDWSPTGPTWTRLLRLFAEGVLLEDGLSTWQPLKREAGTTTDDPHHPARNPAVQCIHHLWGDCLYQPLHIEAFDAKSPKLSR